MNKNVKEKMINKFMSEFKSLNKKEMKEIIEYVELISDVNLLAKNGKFR